MHATASPPRSRSGCRCHRRRRGAIEVDLEVDAAVAADLVVDADAGGERGAQAAGKSVAQVGCRVHAEALGVDHAGERIGLPSPAACSPLLRSFSAAVDGGGRREIAD